MATSRRFRAHEAPLTCELAIELTERLRSWRPGMTISAKIADPVAIDVKVADEMLRVTLEDGREIAAPVAWFPRLRDATDRAGFELAIHRRGEGIHWPDIDEDISVEWLLLGRRNPSGFEDGGLGERTATCAHHSSPRILDLGLALRPTSTASRPSSAPPATDRGALRRRSARNWRRYGGGSRRTTGRPRCR